jgi:hypothetical protein
VARDWVTDEIGRNNYTDTLSSTEPLESLPVGYALRRSDTLGSTVIDLYRIEETVEVGWVSTSKRNVARHRGFFSVVLVDRVAVDHSVCACERNELLVRIHALSQEVDLLREDAKYAVRNSQAPRSVAGRSDVLDQTIELIKNFDRATLRHVAARVGVREQAPAIRPRASPAAGATRESDVDNADVVGVDTNSASVHADLHVASAKLGNTAPPGDSSDDSSDSSDDSSDGDSSGESGSESGEPSADDADEEENFDAEQDELPELE